MDNRREDGEEMFNQNEDKLNLSPTLKLYLDKLSETFSRIVELDSSTAIAKSISIINNRIVELGSSTAIAKSISIISKNALEILDKTPDSMLKLAECGWFIDFEMEYNLANVAAHSIKEGHLSSVDEYFISYYTEHIVEIFDTLERRHPERKHILQEIYSAHIDGRYFLSIPAILSQIDGVCFDSYNAKFFIKDQSNYNPQVTSYILKQFQEALDQYLSPLKNKIPISAREQDMATYQCQLNRHKILHGVDTAYGTEINSLKCLSLLKYISDILKYKD